MKKISIILLCAILLALVVTSTFAIYKTILNGTAQADCGEVIATIVTQEAETIIIDPDNLSIEYDFTVNNYKTENSVDIRNQVVSNYYINITGLSNPIISSSLSYIDDNQVETQLTTISNGEFMGYYETNQILGIDSNTSHNYKLTLTVLEEDLDNWATRVNIDIGYEQDIGEVQHVNSPELTNGLIPVIYDAANDEWKKISSNNSNWYNYEQKKWANAVTVKETGTMTRQEYMDSAEGTTIAYEDITGMFVWIPRFVYRMDSTHFHSEVQENANINIPFEIHFSKTEETGGDEWDDNIIVVSNGVNAEDCKDTWTTHSAFQFGETYLNGFWVAKFQAHMYNSETYIRPAQQIKTDVSANNAFNYCRNMETSSLYGWQTASDIQNDATFLVDGNGIDTHLIKNSEWSAIAFLTYSKYGQENINIPNSIETGEKYSGQSQTTAEIFVGNLKNQSTTANAYGVYDMSSRVWDIVSAYVDPGNNMGAPNIYNALLKYKNVYIPNNGQIDYASRDSVYAIFENVKDAAIWEISTNGNSSYTAWFSGRSNIGCYTIAENKYSLFLARGGAYKKVNQTIDSIFSFGNASGADVNSSRGFRPVLIVHSSL